MPLDLRRLRILVQRATGALPKAIVAAREALESAPSRETLLQLAKLYFQVGDFKSLAIDSRQHTTLSDLTAFDCLTLAFFLQFEDQALALSLWRMAVDKGIQDDHVGMAYQVGNTLGLGVELKPLVHRIAALAAEGRGGVKALGLKEVLDWSVERRGHLEEVLRRLQHGEIPNHTGLGILGVGLIRGFHRAPLLTSARQDGTSVGAVYQRFGGRVRTNQPSDARHKCRLNADITAIINAEHFGLLTKIERAFAPIRLPQNTIVALTRMRNELRLGQPKHFEAKQHVLSAVLGRRIGSVEPEPIAHRTAADGDVADDVLQLLRKATEINALLLDFLPLRSVEPMRDASSFSAEYASRLRDAHCVVDALHQAGALSSAEHLDAIDALGTRHGIPTDSAIPPGTSLICRSAIAELLALAGVLDVAAATFVLTVPANELKGDQIEIDNATVALSDADWTTRLIDHIRDGLTQGVYELLPQAFTGDEEEDQDRERTAEESVLVDLMQFSGSEADVIWIDDRWATSHQQRDGIPIIGTVDLVALLHSSGDISNAEFRDVLTEMRAADVRFIGFDTEELLSALFDAPIIDGELSETKSLRVMRQYYARCLLEGDQLRPPTGAGGALSETNEWIFLQTCGHAIVTALARVWEKGTTEHAAARSEWLLRNMYTEDRGIHGTAMPRNQDSDIYRTCVALVSLVSNSLYLDGDNDLREARREYLEWLYRRTLRARFAASGEFVPMFVEQLKQTIARSMERTEDASEAVVVGLMRRLWIDLPKEVRELMETDQELLRTLGISMKSIVEIGPLRMDRQPFWPGLSSVLNQSGMALLRTVDGHSVAIGLVSARPVVFFIRCSDLQFEGHIGGDELGFLSESFADRETSATRLAHWFDVPKAQREEIVAKITGGQDPATRLEMAESARRRSCEELYRRVFKSVKPGETFVVSEAMPSHPTILLDHLRINQADAIPERWMNSARDLLADIGVVETVNRLAGLPLRLPDSVVSALAALPAKSRRRSLRAIRKLLLASPLGAVHLADLWGRLPDLHGHAALLRRRLARLLCSDGHRPTFNAWLAVLRRVDESFGFNDAMRSLSVETRLALVWAHSDRLFRALMASGLPPSWIESAFEHREYSVTTDLVFPDETYNDDLGAPRHIRAESFVLAGLALICDQRGASDVQEALDDAIEQLNEEGSSKLVSVLMRDITSATNLIGTWLDNRVDQLKLLHTNVRTLFESDTMTSTVRDAFDRIIARNDERSGWLIILGVCAEFPPSESVKTALESALMSISLFGYANPDPWVLIAALGVIGPQVKHLRKEVRAKIEAELLELAKQVRDLALKADARETLFMTILTGLIGCTWWEPIGEKGAGGFAKILEQLANVRSPVFTTSGPLLLRLCEALPASEARHFWRARDLLRRQERL